MVKVLAIFASSLLLASSLNGAASEQLEFRSKNVQLVSSTTDAVVLRSELSNLTSEISEVNGQPYSSLSLPGEATTCYPGRPVLPVVSRFVIVSPTSNLELVISAPEPRRVKAETPPLLYATEPNVSLESQDADGVFPPVIAEMSAPGITRGVRMVKVTVYPVRFDSRTNEYLYYDELETEVRSVGGEAVNPVSHPFRRNTSKSFQKFLSSVAINGSDIGRDDPDRDDPNRPDGHYLVVTHAACLPYIRPFIEWRRKAGYQIDILSLSNDDAHDPGTVQNRIRERYEAYVDAGLEPFDQLFLVGDRSEYSNGQQAQWVLDAIQGTTNWGAGGDHADYLYACIDGRDDYPDVGFSRWISGSQATLDLAVGRTLAYEASPRMDNPDWFGRAAAYSQHWGNAEQSEWHPSIPLAARWGAELLREKGFEDVRFYERFEWDQNGQQFGPWMRDRVNEGVNVMLGRAQNFYWRQEFQGVNDNTVFPINLTAANHGDIIGTTIFRNGDGQHLRGFVAETFTWGELGMTGSILASNMIWLEMARAFMVDDLPLGWARTKALLEFESDLPNFQWQGHNIYPMFKTDFDVIGDPGLQPWYGVPRLVNVELLSESLSTLRFYEVIVRDADDNPAPGVTVTFYAPGAIPNDPADYADYDGYTIRSTLSDQDGRAQFVFDGDEEFVAGTPLFITATGRDIRPVILEEQFEEPEVAIEIADFRLEEIAGNDDDLLNPGEEFALHLRVQNVGQEAVARTIAWVASQSPWIEVTQDQPMTFGNVEAGSEVDGDGQATIRLHLGCPDGELHPESKPVLQVIIGSQQGEWISAIQLDPVAPGFVLSEIIGGDVIPDTVCQLDFVLQNQGRMNAPALNVEIRNLDFGVSIIEAQTTYPAIQASGQAQIDGRLLSVDGNSVVVPGSRHKMMMLLETEAEWRDTILFDLQVENPREEAPQGPDKYGYICFDDTDQNWDIAPEYDWIEIDPEAEDRAFDGESLDFEGQSERDIGEARVIALGFQTQFYGELFDSITVATNGFIAMGSQPRIVNFQNFPLDRGVGGGTGMIAPFWTDLRMNNTSKVLVFHDQASSRFIVEWKNMQFANADDIDLTFQVILYDHDIWITETGDQDILMQYRRAEIRENIRRGDNEWMDGVPFPSVGISSPDCSSGISYTWNNEYPITSSLIEDRRALLFCTSPRYRACGLFGQVYDAETGQPIEGAIVYTLHGFSAITDENGNWEIRNALADFEFDITAHKQGYNDSTYNGLMVEENEELEINFGLLHPEFTLSTDRIRSFVELDTQQDIPFSITNGGNGPLFWSAEKRLLGDANAAPWELRRSYDVGRIVNDDRIEGVAFAEDRFFCSGAAGADSSTIYVLDRDGNQIDSFPQLAHTRYGMKDLEWDGQLLWGSDERQICGFTTDGDSVTSFLGPFNPTNCIAYDSDEDLLWLSGTTTDIAAYDRGGNALDRILNRKLLRIYGLAYWPEDPDGYNLYIMTTPMQAVRKVYKMNTVTGDTILAYQFPADSSSSSGGIFICNTFDVYSWVMMGIQNIASIHGNDRLSIWQLDARKDWMNLNVNLWSGELNANEVQDLSLTLDATGLPDTTFFGEILFHHNADSGTTHLNIAMTVGGPPLIPPFNLLLPANGDSLFGNPDGHLVVRFVWEQVTDQPGDTISYVHWLSAGGQSVHYAVEDTFNVIDLDSLRGLFQLGRTATWWVQAVSGPDTLECYERFSLYIDLGDGVGEEGLTPVEFGLTSLFPSPFNSATAVKFGADKSVKTTLRAFDVHGRLAAVLYDGIPEVGYRQVIWDADGLASGVYLLRLESAGRNSCRKIALIR